MLQHGRGMHSWLAALAVSFFASDADYDHNG